MAAPASGICARRGLDLPGTGREASAVPVPGSRLRSTARTAARIAVTVDRHRLANVRTSGRENRGSTLLHEELPLAPRPAEDRPVEHPHVVGTRDRRNHGLASCTREGATQHRVHRMRRRGVSRPSRLTASIASAFEQLAVTAAVPEGELTASPSDVSASARTAITPTAYALMRSSPLSRATPGRNGT